MQDGVRVVSPAKVNLYLDVRRTLRDDGYHEIRTIFQAIDICDGLELRPRPRGITIHCDDPDVPEGPENLAHAAAAALLADAEIDGGAEIRLRKAIPAQAGLGGGSSNAAATLVGLRKLYSTGHSDGDLETLAAGLGADVAFFIRGGTQIGRGRGELLEPVQPAIQAHLLVVKGPECASTPAVYAEFDREGTEAAFSADQALADLRAGRWEALWNSLAAPAIRLAPGLGRALDALAETGALGVTVAGSGAAVFGLFGSATDAAAASQSLTGAFPFARVCETIPDGVTVIE